MLKLIIAATVALSPAALLANPAHGTHFGNGMGTQAAATPDAPDADRMSGAAFTPTGRADHAAHEARVAAAGAPAAVGQP